MEPIPHGLYEILDELQKQEKKTGDVRNEKDIDNSRSSDTSGTLNSTKTPALNDISYQRDLHVTARRIQLETLELREQSGLWMSILDSRLRELNDAVHSCSSDRDAMSKKLESLIHEQHEQNNVISFLFASTVLIQRHTL
jgi:hypothetical protein